MILLDLFCGAGGMSKGYHEAGFQVFGIDLEPQPNYPYEFHQADALEWMRHNGGHLREFGFVAVHASPPCQAYSSLGKQNKRSYPELVESTRMALESTELPYVIENVVGAPLRDPTLLCGTMFPPLRVRRHRLFETNWPLVAPAHPKEHPPVMTMKKGSPYHPAVPGNDPWKMFLGVYGGTQGAPFAAECDAMGIDWMTKKELNQAIPPAYAKYIGAQLKEAQ